MDMLMDERREEAAMGRQSRRKKKRATEVPGPGSRWRKESRESAEFRRAMAAPNESAFRRVGFVRLNGASIPWIEPMEPFNDHMLFDRLVCRSGLREYFRHPLADEAGKHPGCGILVREVRPGFRLRAVYDLARTSA
jgi:hypothetical protein